MEFDFVDIGAELDGHKIRHIFPVEVSTSRRFFSFALLVLFNLSGMAANNGSAEISNGFKESQEAGPIECLHSSRIERMSAVM